MKNKKENFWIPYADLMTVLMVIFLFIALAYMGLLQEKVGQVQKKVDQVEDVKQKIYAELKTEFDQVASQWNLEINRDLSIRFKDADGLFDKGVGTPSPKFIQILDQFVPRYLRIISNPSYKSDIQEVRVEGHTADDTYEHSIELSQRRANAVLFYLTNHSSFNSLQIEQKRTLQYILTTSGYGWSRALDVDGIYSKVSRKPFDVQSRRVEFRIVTRSDEVIKELNQIKL